MEWALLGSVFSLSVAWVAVRWRQASAMSDDLLSARAHESREAEERRDHEKRHELEELAKIPALERDVQELKDRVSGLTMKNLGRRGR